jgi:hypothetical protein
MLTTQAELAARQLASENEWGQWRRWPVNWSAIIVGALATFAFALLVSLVAVAVGAHNLDPQNRVVDLKKISMVTAAIGIAGSFFAFVVGGWVAGKIAGIFRSEHAMLHGAIVWLVAVPTIGMLATLGMAGSVGTWYAGLAGHNGNSYNSTPFIRPDALSANATAEELQRYTTATTEYQKNVAQWREETPKAVRNSALCAVTSILVGLMGSALGGWMASGEPMTFGVVRHRKQATMPT